MEPDVNNTPAKVGEPPVDRDIAKVKLLSPKGRIPERATADSTGYDVYSAVTTEIQPGQSTLIPTDITFVPPTGTYGQLYSRSGLSAKHGINVTAGTIDPDFRGNIMVNLFNSSSNPFTVNIGDRIAQLVFYYTAQPTMVQHNELDETGQGNI